MLKVIIVDNPFDPFLTSAARHDLDGVGTVRQCAEKLFPGFVEFENPTLCLVDGQPFMRKHWDDTLQEASTVTFVRLAQGVVEIIIAVVLIIVAVVMLVVIKANNAAIGADSKTQKNGDPVYSLSGQSNQNKLNNAIECAYGINKFYPAYAGRPYNVYKDNKQYQFSLFCLGHGSFYINPANIKFGDTITSAFQEVTVEIYPPGTSPTLVHSDVRTVATVANIELFGKNEDGYITPPTPHTVSEVGAPVNRLEVDFSLPAGLYKVGEGGDLEKLKITAIVEYRKINDAGTPISDWSVLFNFKKSMNTNTPQRFTLWAMVDLARYQVRARRTNSKDETIRAGNTLIWESLRGFIPFVNNFGDVTLIGVKALATNQLNNNASQQFNVVAERLLQKWDPVNGWSAVTYARNPVWAFCDVFMANYGGRLPDTFLDLNALYDLSLYYDENNIHFDYIFDQRATVWEAARAVARAGRGVPMLSGSQLTIIRDTVKTVATAVFNQHNIIANSLQWSIKLPSNSEYDGVEIEYVDATTWSPETVLCLIGDDEGVNPERIKLPGVISRDRAFQEGMYERAIKLYSKESIEFKTGLEGHLPTFGDLILVTHDVPRWGTGGLVLEIDGTGITLNNPVTFADGVHKLILRKKDGSAYGPVTCNAGPSSTQVVVTPAVTEEFYFDDIHEKPYFLFGKENMETRRCVVVGVMPEGEDVVTIQCIAYDERIFSFSGVETPPIYSTPRPTTIPDAPVVSKLYVRQADGTTDYVTVYWPPALGARLYTVEISPDGTNWTQVSTPTMSFAQIRSFPGLLYIRVAGINVDRGPYATWTGTISDDGLPANVTGLVLSASAHGSVTVRWDATSGASGYNVAVLAKASSQVVRSVEVFTNYFRYDLLMGSADGLRGRNIQIRVRARNATGVSATPATIDVIIPPNTSEPPVIPDQLLWSSTRVPFDNTDVTFDHS